MPATPNRRPAPLRWAIPSVAGAVLLVALWVGLDRGFGTEVDFNRDIRPVLNEQCVTCHGGIRQQGDLSLLFRTDALQPARSGRAAITPGDQQASELLRRVRHADPSDRMPKDADPLSEEQIDLLRAWIAAGAEWDQHWAYVAPTLQDTPAVSDPSWPVNGIDTYVMARLDQEGLTPSREAECSTLVRRVSLDLIGLPPTPEKVNEVCGSADPEAYAAFVDGLLVSPSFGERWAAMWLDLARYADSKGYEKDAPRTIWRYRDWVIEAFNRDMPFDRFTIEQLAGDLLPGATQDQRIATAFHRNTMTNDEGGTDDEEHRLAAVVDRVNTTWEVWQGTSMGCAQCHGHPYDPFRHEDYYRILAFFNNTADWDQADERPTLAAFPEGREADGQRLLGQIAALEERMAIVAAESAETRREWEARLDDPEVVGKISEQWQNEVLRIRRTPESDRDDAQRAHIDFVFAEVHSSFESLREDRNTRRAEVRQLEPLLTPVMQELPEGRRRTTSVLDRGNFLLPLHRVEPGVPASMPSMPEDARRDRLGLARWLVSDENPLTARVIVNRFWEQLMGMGLVETLEDFGTRGEPPSHPELLDWLALQFRHEHDWSVKALLRQVVMSATYRQSSVVSAELLARDPRNKLLARGPRVRLAAEQLRDQALAVSGLLSAKMYGPSVYPYQPHGLWLNPYSNADWQTSEGEDRYRRGLYTYWRRTVPYPAMTTFDSPSREFCVSRRVRTNTPLQALVMLNDPAYVEAAQALAARMVAEASAPGDAPESDAGDVGSAPDSVGVSDFDTLRDARLSRGVALALGRAPSEEMLGTLRVLYDEAASYYATASGEAAAMTGGAGDAELAALTVVANAILNLDAFVMKE